MRSHSGDGTAAHRLQPVNGQPGVVFTRPDGSVAWVAEFEVVDGLLAAIRSVSNPDKLAHFAAG